MLESKACKTYYAFASGEKTPKPKYVRKKADSDTSPKQKPVQATKGTRLKKKATLAKFDKKKQPAKKPKAKGLAVLSESKVLDEQHLKTAGADEGTSTILGVLDVPIYESESEKESRGNSEDKDELEFLNSLLEACDLHVTRIWFVASSGDDDNDGNNGSDSDDDDANDDDKQESDDMNDDDEKSNSDKTKSDGIKIHELYDDVNENLENEDTKMTNADQGASEQQNASQQSGFEQEEEDAHVTLTPVFDTQKTGGPTQSSSVSSDFTSKLLNLDNLSPTDNEIASLMDTTSHHTTTILEITSSFTTSTPPPPLLFNPLSQQATPTLTPMASEITTSLPTLLDFAFVFKFNERVSNLKKDLSEMKQVDQYDKVISSIPAIVNHYIDNKLGEAINKAIQAHNFNWEFNTQLPQILPQAILDVTPPIIEKNVTESLEVVVLTRKSCKEAEPSKDSRSKEKKSSSTSKDASKSQHVFRQICLAEEPSHTIEDLGVQQDQEFDTGNNDEHPVDKEVTKADCQVTHAEEPPTSFDELNDTSFDFSAFVMNMLKILNLTQEILVGSAFNLLKGTCKSITELECHFEECSKATTERLDWRKILLRTDELHKFSDGTLNDVRSVLYDIDAGIRMEYMPMGKWSNLDKKMARVMVHDIDKQLYQRRLMQNLEKFVGGREYGNDLKLLEWTI
uniref:Uncharacterized protein n=1 Tax=Tanacetum cinerariifolium TaxID=118510 RepID=A0A6L2K2D5_TANCI|nr:hypothetical protein [Tanacetum cinerariifolium]